MRLAIITALVVAVAVAWTDLASAALPATPNLTAEQRAEVQRIESYLNEVSTVKARFRQISSDGETAVGTFFMSRPGKLRVEYDPPSGILVVADGSFLVYFDRTLDQISYIPLGSTPASILLDEHISIDNPALLLTGFLETAEAIEVSLVRKESLGEGELTLVFDQSPLRLREWRIVDAQGIITQVSLADAKFGVPVDSALFTVRNPRLPGADSFPSGR